MGDEGKRLNCGKPHKTTLTPGLSDSRLQSLSSIPSPTSPYYYCRHCCTLLTDKGCATARLMKMQVSRHASNSRPPRKQPPSSHAEVAASGPVPLHCYQFGLASSTAKIEVRSTSLSRFEEVVSTEGWKKGGRHRRSMFALALDTLDACTSNCQLSRERVAQLSH